MDNTKIGIKCVTYQKNGVLMKDINNRSHEKLINMFRHGGLCQSEGGEFT